MADDVFSLRVLTPAGSQVEAKVREVTLPTAAGEVGVLTKHAKYTGIVGTGILQFVASDNSKTRIVVSGGFASFANDTLTILADAVFTAENVDKGNFAKDKPELQKTVQTASTFSAEWQIANEKLQRIEAVETLLQ